MGMNTNQVKIHATFGDITKITFAEAIVNSSNQTLSPGDGKGVNGAIHRAAGKGLFAECQKLGGCKVGEAKITGAYNLPCKYVIHTCGPVWHGGNKGEPALLANCYQNSLYAAMKHGIRSVAFPSISTGTYGFPVNKAAEIAVGTVCEFMMRYLDKFDLIVWLLYDVPTKEAYGAALDRMSAKMNAPLDALMKMIHGK
ncbi:MAG: macro domain-containing protein [Thermoguttaceae bacterium]|nr:macro domain-containing protein [Thermoguttaceae bacterium]